eukprot:8749743-Alexandrium_andersonii.AAC.1
MLAAMLDAPTHVALDSANVFRTFLRLRGGGVDLQVRPWGLRRDGDMWAILHELMEARGWDTMTLKK